MTDIDACRTCGHEIEQHRAQGQPVCCQVSYPDGTRCDCQEYQTATDLEAIRARLKAATPGPWEWTDESGTGRRETLSTLGESPIAVLMPEYDVDGAYIEATPDDATFITHAPQDIADLLAEVERLNRHIDDLVASR